MLHKGAYLFILTEVHQLPDRGVKENLRWQKRSFNRLPKQYFAVHGGMSLLYGTERTHVGVNKRDTTDENWAGSEPEIWNTA